MFTDGSLNTFAKLTNVDTHSRLICYDRGIRPLREGDLTFSEEIILSGHGLNFQFDFTSDEAQREVLGPAADCLEPGGWLDILCNYDAARQEADATLSLTLHRQDGVVQKLFTYPRQNTADFFSLTVTRFTLLTIQIELWMAPGFFF